MSAIEIPKIDIPPEKMAARRRQMTSNYFQFWIEVFREEGFSEEKINEMIIKWGRKQGEHTAKLYKYFIENKGVNIDDIPEFVTRVMMPSSLIMDENCHVCYLPDKKELVYRTITCPTGKMIIDLGIDPMVCVKQCDEWLTETFKALPDVKYIRTKNFVDDGICEWEFIF